MDEIRPWLYIGNYSDTKNISYLRLLFIESVLQLAAPVRLPGINFLYMLVEDMEATPPNLIRQGVDFVLGEKAKERKILVACGAGMNRLTMFCVAALKETEGISLLDAFKDIKRKHPASMPHAPVWNSFCNYYNEPTPYFDVMRFSMEQ